ncbi:hypothetical protein DFH11DRAFT_1590989 [Phellopilus nigrolimitatus]|nr:hypothetical protein DFH11DRAFT_1590989 [Phellopilus nigrolimitatus]
MSSSPTSTSTTALTATKTATAAPTKFTVVVRDEEFTLRRSQLNFDAPNYFTAYFFGDFAESGTTVVHVDRSPELFAIIVEYLSGYTILPLAAKALPRTMDGRTALLNLVEDAAFYGLSGLYAHLTAPRQPTIDFAWTGFSSHVVSFEDVLKGKLPESVSYTTSGLCSFDYGAVKPVIIWARNIALKLVGNTDLDKTGRPDPNDTTATYRLCLPAETKAQLERQPYSAFEFCDADPHALVVSVFPESRLRVDGAPCRFEHFAHWWRARRAPGGVHFGFGYGGPPRADVREAERVFDEAFPPPFEDTPARGEWCDRSEFALWGDELMFVITARGFIAGTLQLHVKLLDVRARTRAAVLETLRPPFLVEG